MGWAGLCLTAPKLKTTLVRGHDCQSHSGIQILAFHFATLITDYHLKLLMESHPNFIPGDYRSGLSRQDQLRKVSFFGTQGLQQQRQLLRLRDG